MRRWDAAGPPDYALLVGTLDLPDDVRRERDELLEELIGPPRPVDDDVLARIDEPVLTDQDGG